MNILCKLLAFLWLCVPLLPGAPADAAGQDDAETLAALQEALADLCLDPNRATAEALAGLPWMDQETARKIVAFREASGPIRSLENLSRMPGMSPETLDQIAPYLSFSTPIHITGKTRWRLTHPSGPANPWDRLRITHRSECQIGNGLTAVLSNERRPGETGFIDHWSGYLLTNRLPGRPRLFLGDMRPAYGQGILFSRRTRPVSGWAGAQISPTDRIGYRVTPETGALRGLYLSARKTHLTLSGIVAGPSAGGSQGLVVIRIAPPSGALGITAAHLVSPPPGQPNRALGLDGQFRTHGLSFFCELAATGSASAWLLGVKTRLNTLQITALARRYGPAFQSPLGAPFSAYSSKPQNEWGLFAAARWRLTARTRLEMSLDRHGRIARTDRLALPGRGEKGRLALTRRVSRLLTLDLALNTQRETVRIAGQTGPRTRRRLGARFTYRKEAVRFRAWLERARGGSPSRQGAGQALGATLKASHPSGRWLSIWTGVFNIDAYEARIYTFDPDVWGGSRLQVLTGRGQTAGLLLGWETRHARLALRYSQKRANGLTVSSWALQADLTTGR